MIAPVSQILNREDTNVTFIYDAITIRKMTQIRSRDDVISSLNVCWAVCSDTILSTMKVNHTDVVRPKERPDYSRNEYVFVV